MAQGFSMRGWALLITALLIILSLETRWFLTTQLPFLMDELVDTQLAVDVDRGADLYVDRPWERMPLMTWILAGLHDADSSSFEAVIAGRRLMWIVTAVTLLGTWFVARRICSPLASAGVILLLVGFSNFLERSIRVRADSLSTMWSLGALYAVTAPRLRARELMLAGASLGLAFATTQKAAYFIVAFVFSLGFRRWAEGFRGRNWVRRVAIDGALSSFALTIPLGGLIAFMGLQYSLGPFLQQTLVYGAEVGLSAETYAGTWKFLVSTILRNPGFWCLGFVGAIVTVWKALDRPRNGSPTVPEGAAGAWTIVLFLLILQHTTKFPYVFLNLAPGLAVCGGITLAAATRWAVLPIRRIDWRHLIWSTGFFVLLLLLPAIFYFRAFAGDLLWWQKAIMDRVDEITQPEDAVLDGIGMATTRRKAATYSLTARWFDERRAGRYGDFLEQVVESEPPVMILNYRLKGLPPAESAFLKRRYVPDWSNVWVAGATIHHPGGHRTKEMVDLIATGDYAILAEHPAGVRVDGVSVESVERLGAGEHEVAIEGREQTVILKYAGAVRYPPPPSQPVISLFPSYWAP